jgi:hypothetical protein
MADRSLVRLFFAALCATLPFIFPFQCSLLIFCWPFLLFTIFNTQSPSVLLLFWWSLAVTTLQMLPVCDALINMASGPLWLRCLPPLAVLLYLTLHLTFFLYSAARAIAACARYSSGVRAGVWICGVWLWFIFSEYALLWIGKIGEGCIFLNPLLPLATLPQFLHLFYPQCLPVALFLLCIVSDIGGRWIPKYPFYSLFILALAVWATSRNAPSVLPPALSTIAHLPLFIPATLSANRATTTDKLRIPAS